MAKFFLEDVGNCTVYSLDNIDGVQTRANKIRAMAPRQSYFFADCH